MFLSGYLNLKKNTGFHIGNLVFYGCMLHSMIAARASSQTFCARQNGTEAHEDSKVF